MQGDAKFNPFPGLRPFEPEEDHLFFGREKEIDELLRRLRFHRFVSVVGTSGSGKSSLVRSGLIPALQSGLMAKAGSSWRVSVVRPGVNPITNLAVSLNAPDVLGAEDRSSPGHILLEATLRRSALGLVEACRRAQIAPDDNLLVVVDQFEELFRFRQNCQNENLGDEAVAFVKLILEATQQNELPIYVVLTMRSDFIGDCTEYPGLPEAVNAGMYLVSRMTREEVRSAITGPVAVAGGQIAPRLVLRLLNDLGSDQDRLPVLQHALMRTWEHWQESGRLAGPMDLADYEAIGTVGNALSLHAEDAYKQTGDEKHRRITQRLFKSLTDTYSDPRGVRRPTSIRELAAICDAPEADVIQIVEIFREKGRSFLMPPPEVALESDSVIDISHESLMRCWDRLAAWAEEERSSAEFYERLSKAAAWFEEGKAGLWRDPELEFAIRWWKDDDPTQAWALRYDGSFMNVLDFLDRSMQDRDRIAAEVERARRQRLQRLWALCGGLIVVVAVVAFLGWQARRASALAQTNYLLARRAVDQSLSAAAATQQASEVPDPPQLVQFRQQLLDKAEDFYTKFLDEQTKSDVGFRAQSALVHSKLGDINRLRDDREVAADQYKMAISEFDALHAQNSSNLEYRQALGYAHTWLGETLRRWSEETRNMPDRRPDAQRQYDSALQLQQGLHEERPQNVTYQQELGRTYDNRGILDYDERDLKKSESDFNEAIRLLEPLSKQELASQAAPGENPPSHDLVLVYNNLSALNQAQNQLPEAQALSKQAILIQESLVARDSDNWEYREELVIFRNNLASLAFGQGDRELAALQNHAALDSIEELATPVPIMERARATAHMLYPTVGSPNHPEFHVLYMHLADEYVKMATRYVNSNQFGAARMALQSLERVVPQVAEPYRSQFMKSQKDLQRQLSEAESKKLQ